MDINTIHEAASSILGWHLSRPKIQAEVWYLEDKVYAVSIPGKDFVVITKATHPHHAIGKVLEDMRGIPCTKFNQIIDHTDIVLSDDVNINVNVEERTYEST